jgi:hypothetical protein
MAQIGDGGCKAALRRGGARNRADRQSVQLTEQHCRKLIAAAGAAWAGGTPFNRFATLAFGKSGIDTRDCVAATGDWIKLARDWFASHSLPMPWAWCRNGDGSTKRIVISCFTFPWRSPPCSSAGRKLGRAPSLPNAAEFMRLAPPTAK